MAEQTSARKIFSFGPAQEAAVEQLERCLDVHHKGYSMPIGGVLASQSMMIPAGVGYDIACGNAAVRTNVKAGDIATAHVTAEFHIHDNAAGSRRPDDDDADLGFDMLKPGRTGGPS